jgi:predicted permease
MFYGADTAHIAMLYDVFGIGPLLYTLGAIIAASHSALSVSQHAKAEKLKAGLFLFLKTPPLWAAALGLGLSLLQMPLPALLDHSFDIMGRAVTPVMVFSVGLALQLPRTKRDWMFLPWLLPAAFVKLVVAPFVAMLLVALSEKIMITGLVPLEKKALVLEAGMSTMVVTLVVSDLFGLDTKTCARLIALTTLLSFITIPIFA